ncbi:MAG TPA: methionyl-tRNA formyltransferase [Gammaproteobacteria bacterium]|nr:methionyl-tRNA formyltransferase [Gammaproteobacteria bacterium]
MRIVFAGTPEFAVPTLEALAASDRDLAAVYTQPDRRAGRGRRTQAPPVKRRALELELPVRQPATLREPEVRRALAGLRPDLMVVVAYGLILPPEVLAIPRLGCVNVHASLLPRWRGAAPVARAILAGDRETGISIMRMDAGLDTGPLLLQQPCAIEPEDTAGSLTARLAALGARGLLEALPGIETGSLLPRPQPREGVTYADKLRKDEAAIDWRRSAVLIERQVRGLNPWPVAQTPFDDAVLRIWRARALPQAADGAPGTVVAAGRDGIDVATGEGRLRLLEAQLPGGRRISGTDLANAGRVPSGTRLGRSR